MSLQILRDRVQPIRPAYRGSNEDAHSFRFLPYRKGRKGRRKNQSSGRRPTFASSKFMVSGGSPVGVDDDTPTGIQKRSQAHRVAPGRVTAQCEPGLIPGQETPHTFVLDHGNAPGYDCCLPDVSPAELSTNRGLPIENKHGGGTHAYPDESRVARRNTPGESKPNRPGGEPGNAGNRPVNPLVINAGAGERTLPRFISATPTPLDALGETSEHRGDLLALTPILRCDKAGDAYGVPGEGVGSRFDMWF